MYYKTGIHTPTLEDPAYFVYPSTNDCRLIADSIYSNENGCPIHPGCSCTHGLDSYKCEYGLASVK